MTRVTTPWGQAQKVGEAVVPQRAGDRRFSTVVQLLETENGERLVRFAYTTDGIVRRGPVTLRERDVTKLWEAVRRAPDLDATLRNGLDGQPRPVGKQRRAAPQGLGGARELDRKGGASR